MQLAGGIRHSASSEKQSYWAFIDGLRAIAVLSVVLYHAGVLWLPGGYVGVDIFFVISGYLIIGQIVSEKARAKFSFAEFWSRRALRILPPYLLVILACSAVAPIVLVMPGEFQAFANEVAYSALMVVNHYFLDQQGYFDRGADTKVLLHLWSLAVEEQFYIVAPLLIAALWGLKHRLYHLTIATLFALSLWGCIALTGQQGDKNYAFFIMPLRAWEFIAGGAVALAVPYLVRLPRIAIEVVAISGAGAIYYAVTGFSHSTPFPSYWAAIPVFGSAAIILAGMSGPNIVKTILRMPPLVGIGLISYSWYLWHWPALVFARIYNFGEHIPAIDASMVALSAALATATYFLIEKPIRIARKNRTLDLGWRPTLIGITTCLVVCFAGYGIFVAKSVHLAESLKGGLLPLMPVGGGPCDLRSVNSADDCKAQNGSRSLGVLIGDSQADAAARQLVKTAKQNDVAVLFLASGGCISMLDAKTHIPDSIVAENCLKYRQKGRDVISATAPSFAILYSRWTLYADPHTPYYFVDGANSKAPDQKAAFVDGARRSIDQLRQFGIKRILVIGPTPTFPTSAPECVTRSLNYKQPPDIHCSQYRNVENKKRELAVSWLTEALRESPDVRVIDPTDVFCDSDFCRPYAENMVYFIDTNHIADAGMAAIYSRHQADFEWAFFGEP